MSTIQARVKDSLGDKIFLITVYILLSLLLIVVLYPLIYVISSSFSSPAAVTSGKVWLWPVELSLKGYSTLIHNEKVTIGYANSLFYTGVGTIISVVLTIMIAYPLSRKTFFGKNVLMMLITFTMLFSGGLIPTY